MNADHLKYCPVCAGEGTVAAKSKLDTRVVRGETYEVQSDYFECSQCEEPFMPREGDLALRRAWEQYREKHGMVTPQELSAWRDKLGVTQPELAAILSWGVVTVSRYENGKLQEAAHDKELRLAMHSSENTLELVERAEGLSEETRARLTQQLKHEARADAVERAYVQQAALLPGKTLNIKKLLNLVVLLCGKQGVFITKLNKLLFYVDFKSYKERHAAVSELCYERLPRGPVPSRYSLLYAMLEELGAVRLLEEASGPYDGLRVVALVDPDKNCFSDDELGVILDVRRRFEKMNTTQISDFSHEEAAWIETATGSLISYEHAASLSI